MSNGTAFGVWLRQRRTQLGLTLQELADQVECSTVLIRKIESGEQPRDALRRELEEELGIDATIGEEVARIRHEYRNGAAVELRFFTVREYKGEIENRIFKDMRWAERSELASFDFLEADLGLVRDLVEGKIV